MRFSKRKAIGPILSIMLMLVIITAAAVIIIYMSDSGSHGHGPSNYYPSGVNSSTRLYQTTDPNALCASGFVRGLLDMHGDGQYVSYCVKVVP